jgi:citrate lyase subunit beta/citryl-CoA lyase
LPEPRYRSYLFTPGTSERLVTSALKSSADAVVIDLEDAIVADDRALAFDVVRAAASVIHQRPTHVRIGIAEGGYIDSDVDLAVEVGALALRLPKVSRPEEVGRVSQLLDKAEDRHGRQALSVGLYLTIEDAAGLVAARELAAASRRVARFVFGERDFMADLGVDSPGTLLGHARASLAIASRASGVGAPVDGAFIDLEDEAGLRASASQAKNLGFSGKSALHPRQLEVLHSVFATSAEEIVWAKRVVDAYASAINEGSASLVVDGQYVDAAVVRRARAIMEEGTRDE